jgi:hypothetical protein
MTLLNTMANLGGTWPASFVMKLIGWLTPDAGSTSSSSDNVSKASSWFGGDPYELVQTIFTVLGLLWLLFLGPVVRRLAALPDDAWRTNESNDEKDGITAATTSANKPQAGGARQRSTSKTQTSLSAMESGVDVSRWKQAKSEGKIE